MDYNNDTPSTRKNKHLNAYERGQIQLLNSEGLTPYAIGKRLGRAPNTIRNELKRGTVPQIKGNKTQMIYYPDTGQAVYEKNRRNSGF
ncbi:IS30 family transposase [Desulfitispora alkaliphila]